MAVTEMSILKKELSFYKATGQKSATLEKLYKALLTIKPSSVASERAFLGLAKTTGRIAKRVKRKAALLKIS